jgi:hypothetical protein
MMSDFISALSATVWERVCAVFPLDPSGDDPRQAEAAEEQELLRLHL